MTNSNQSNNSKLSIFPTAHLSQFLINVLLQLLIFFSLLLSTHYWMSKEDIFSIISFSEISHLLILTCFYMAALCVILIQLFSVFSNHLSFRLLGFLFGFLQIYLNFTYFEYYIVFKTPLFGKDIVYMEDPAAVWQLAKGSVLNIRFLFFILLPTTLLAVTQFYKKLNPKITTAAKTKLVFLIALLLFSFVIYQYQGKLADKFNQNRTRVVIGYERSTLIVAYEAIANYLQYEEIIITPDDPTEIRKILIDQGQEYTRSDYPILQSSLHLKKEFIPPIKAPIKRNIIILMFESLPLAEVHALSRNPDYKGTTPFLDELLPQSVYFPNTYATGIHTYFGLSDLLTGVPSYDFKSWNKKLELKLTHALPYLLQDNGYQELIWYHGGSDQYFDQLYNFSDSVGFKKRGFFGYFSKDAKKSNWGISDREVLRKAAKDIKSYTSPFITFVLTLSKHGPWNTPPDFDEEGFNRDYLSRYPNAADIPDDGLRNSKRLIYYSDQVLREFFQSLAGHPNFENSLVIITSDQAFFPDIKSDNTYQSMKNGFNIPLIFHEPGREKVLTPGKQEIVASHLDIIPTLIDYLNLDLPDEVPYFGKNLFNPEHKKNPNQHNHIGFWNDYLFHFNQNNFFQLSMGEDSQINLIDNSGKSSISKDEIINQKLTLFKSIYPYLIQQDKVFPTVLK